MANDTIAHSERIFQELIKKDSHKSGPPEVCLS